jgi:hypothetical protein
VTAGFIVHQGVTVADEESCWWRMERDGDPRDMHSTYSTPTYVLECVCLTQQLGEVVRSRKIQMTTTSVGVQS